MCARIPFDVLMMACDCTRGDGGRDGLIQDSGVARFVFGFDEFFDGLTRHSLAVGICNNSLDDFLWNDMTKRAKGDGDGNSRTAAWQ